MRLPPLALTAISVALASGLAVAQQTVVIPAGYDTADGTTSNVFPWSYMSSSYTGIRMQQFYDESHFLTQGISSPIVIQGMRLREDGGDLHAGGVTFNNVVIQMASGTVDYTAATHLGGWAPNLGPDLTTVFNGSYTTTASSGASPNNWIIDIPFATPFTYDPGAGNDLVIDVDRPMFAGMNFFIDSVSGSSTLGAQVYGYTQYPNATSSRIYAFVCELIYTVVPNAATKSQFGEGCNEEYASFYESHSAFDLSNTSLGMTNMGNGYLVVPGATPMATPTAASTTMGDDQVLQFPLGWTMPYPGGTTTDLWISSNGFVHLTANTATAYTFDLNLFLSGGPVFAAKWRDLNPSASGTVTFESDTTAQTATITFDMVPDYGVANANSFQYFFDSQGNVEMRFGAVANTSGTTGFSPGNNNVDPGSIDLSATPVIVTGANDVQPLTLDADARPIIGTSINLTIGNIPTGTAIAAHVFGWNSYMPGIDLSTIGMQGCFQHISQDAVGLTINPTGSTAGYVFPIPNSPVLQGRNLFAQGAVLDPAGGHNTLGALSSNGLQFMFDIN